MRIDFDWDPAKAASNATKHGVTFEEAMTIFRDPLARSILDRDSGSREERWAPWARQPWTEIDPDRSVVRIISARRPAASEARQYRENPMP